MASSNTQHDEEINIFQEYLRIPSVHPNIDYEPCLAFLRKQAESLNLPHKTINVIDDRTKKILLITWKGTNPEHPSILLNSHMDVVPVFEENWTHPPFGAEIHDGKIYARGSQDMKCVGTQYLGAIRAMKKSGFQPNRTIHVSFVPEEELRSEGGMKDFVQSEEFKELNVGFAMDEAGASTIEPFIVFFAERTIWQIKFVINGKPGPGLQLFEGTVSEKATYLMNKLDTFRKSQIDKIRGMPPHMPTASAINLTKMEGGVQTNVIPPQVSLTYDMRLAIDVDLIKFEKQLRDWCEEAGGDIEMVFIAKEPLREPTQLDDSNEYWKKFKEAINELGITVIPMICPGATDARFLREIGISAIGFSPINNTPVLLHDHDEYLGVDTYLRGIKIYQKIIEHLTS